MQCANCGHVNETARFCVKCGAPLEAATASEFTSGDAYSARAFTEKGPSAASKPNIQVQQVKQISKQYFSFFLQVLRNPVLVSQSTSSGHMVNGLLTLILFSLFLPLITYFQLKSALRGIGFGFARLESQVSFGGVVIKPFIYLLLAMLLVTAVLYFVIRVGNKDVQYQEVTARFGAFMIPATAFNLLALLFSFISARSFLTGALIGLGLFSWVVAVCFVIYSFKQEHKNGLDPFYAVVLTFVASIIIISLLWNDIFSGLLGNMGNSFIF